MNKPKTHVSNGPSVSRVLSCRTARQLSLIFIQQLANYSKSSLRTLLNHVVQGRENIKFVLIPYFEIKQMREQKDESQKTRFFGKKIMSSWMFSIIIYLFSWWHFFIRAEMQKLLAQNKLVCTIFSISIFNFFENFNCNFANRPFFWPARLLSYLCKNCW